MTQTAPRTRIAPSPTGAPHIGTAYIALHNMALAKSLGGQFILRIEDTDRERSTPESEKQILEGLKWLGLDWDEGPDIGGDYGPYRQSERAEIYREKVALLVEKGEAYACFCSKERLDQLRKKQMEEKTRLGYDGHCRNLRLEESTEKIRNGEAHVIRLKVPRGQNISFHDGLRNQDIEISDEEVDDQVLLKADGFPTYHLANVVDDYLMKISHVLRGEEWISSTPKHILLYRAFGWTPPTFLHLPLLRNADKSKISKRRNPTSLSWFRARGYAKPALQNFLGLMGYSREDGREFFSFEEFVQDYDKNRLSTTAPVFDFEKLERCHSNHVQAMSDQAFLEHHLESTKAALEYMQPLGEELKKRYKSRMDFDYWSQFAFERELEYDPESFEIKGLEKDSALAALKALQKQWDREKPQTPEAARAMIDQIAESLDLKKNSLYMLTRICLSGRKDSLPLFESMIFLGPESGCQRLKHGAAALRSRKTPKKS